MARTATYREALYEALREEMTDDSSVIMLGEDFSNGGAFGVAGDLPERFGPERVVRTPMIREEPFEPVVLSRRILSTFAVLNIKD